MGLFKKMTIAMQIVSMTSELIVDYGSFCALALELLEIMP